MPPDLLAQFPLAERAIEALGIRLWPMVEWEADDALAAAAARFHGAPGVERILICSVDKDLAQCVRGTAVVLWDRRRNIFYDEDGVRAKWGVPPESIPDYLALVGDSSDGYPGIPGFGAKTAAALLARWGHLEQVPVKGSAWDLPGVRNAVPLAQVLVERLGEAMLYRDLARLRTAEDGVPIPERSPDELAWAGADRAAWEAFCDELGLGRLRGRPHRWASA
jgi:5'-3' exonuclease